MAEEKRFEIITGQTRCRVGETLSTDWICANIIFSLQLCMVCVTGPEALISSEDYSGVWKEGTRLAMPKTNLRARLLIIEARFRGY